MKKLQKIVIALLIIFVILYVINSIAKMGNNTTTNTQSLETEKDILNNGMSYLDEDKYKFVCKEMDYNHVMFTDENLTNKYAKMDITLVEQHTLSLKDMKNENIEKIVNAYNLQTDYFTGVIKNKDGEYTGEKIFIYFSKDYDLKNENYKDGDRIIAYGLITNCKNNGAGRYNSISFIPRFIEQ